MLIFFFKYRPSGKQSQTQGLKRTKIDNYPVVKSGQRFTAVTLHFNTRNSELNRIGKPIASESDTV